MFTIFCSSVVENMKYTRDAIGRKVHELCK